MGNSLIRCCCRAKSQGEAAYSASTEQQAHRACPQKKSHQVPSPGVARPGEDATLWEACCVAFHVMKTVPVCEIRPVAETAETVSVGSRRGTASR